MAAETGWQSRLPPPHEAEVVALLEALQWLLTLPYESVYVEIDCKHVVNNLNDPSIHHLEYGIILTQCSTLLTSHNNLKVRFIKRQANCVTHSLARVLRSFASPHSFDFIPPYIASIIMNEIS
uniref:RNase H type-1 domain-containing protein n=1 Tax=Cajanus cajan TaxID=3821 RepID=A0A151QN41_CAJCA|nr:hypothetical protein KK1_047817 [Cajanus cajan]